MYIVELTVWMIGLGLGYAWVPEVKMKNRAALGLGVMLALSPFAQSQQNSALSASFPGKGWAIQIPTSGFKVEVNELQADGRNYLLATNEKNGVTISVFMERSAQNATAEECHDSTSKRAQQAASEKFPDMSIHDVGPFSVLEYTIAEVNGAKLNQRNIFACLAKEDVYADVHISKVNFRPPEEGLLMAYLEGARVVDLPAGGAKPPVRDSMEYFKEGSRFYLKQDFKNAIGPYQDALDLEKVNPKLGQTFWRVLVDNLAMAYGITGDLKNSKEVLVYGISKDATYPTFYYNMACMYAESQDIDNTMANLKKAFQYKQNTIKGETMPNPRTDDSFQRFMHTKQFLDLLDSLEHQAD
jgi:tetratricopeptide (TPR) repeat protein